MRVTPKISEEMPPSRGPPTHKKVSLISGYMLQRMISIPAMIAFPYSYIVSISSLVPIIPLFLASVSCITYFDI